MLKKRMMTSLLTVSLLFTSLTPIGVYAGTSNSAQSPDQMVVTESAAEDSDIAVEDDFYDVIDAEAEISGQGTDNPFSDVTEEAWYYRDVMNVLERKIMTGTSATEFSPASKTTRGMVVTMLYRADGEPPCAEESGFLDVADESWYHDAVNWAFENQIVLGYTPTEFGPNDPVTLEQLVTILSRYNETVTNPQTEDPDGAVAEEEAVVEERDDASDIMNDAQDDPLLQEDLQSFDLTEESGEVFENDPGESMEDESVSKDESDFVESEPLIEDANVEEATEPDPSTVDLSCLFQDADAVSGYALDALKWAVLNKYVQGDMEGHLNPCEPIVRSQVAALFSRFLGEYRIDEDGELMASSIWIPNSTYAISSALSSRNRNFVIDAKGKGKKVNTNIQIYDAHYHPNQIYRISHVRNNYYRIIDSNSGLALSVAGARRASKVNVRLEKYKGSDSQLWRFQTAKSNTGFYYIQNKLGYYLDVQNGKAANSTNVWVYSKNGKKSQVFKLDGYSQSGKYITVGGVKLSDYPIGSSFSSSRKYYYNVRGKQTYLAAIQCFGYANYVQKMLFDKYNQYYVINGTIRSASDLEKYVKRAGVGAHIRVNGNRHSLAVIAITKNGFTVTQANGNWNLRVNDTRTYTYSEFIKKWNNVSWIRQSYY